MGQARPGAEVEAGAGVWVVTGAGTVPPEGSMPGTHCEYLNRH